MRWINRLFHRPKRDMGEVSLAELIARVSGKPTIENRNAFYQAILHSKLGLRLSKPIPGALPGQTYVTRQDTPVKVSTTVLPDGTEMLVAVCNTPRIWNAHPNEHYIEMEAKVIFQMALQGDYQGVIVRNGDKKDSWAGIPVGDILDLLTGRYG